MPFIMFQLNFVLTIKPKTGITKAVKADKSFRFIFIFWMKMFAILRFFCGYHIDNSTYEENQIILK